MYYHKFSIRQCSNNPQRWYVSLNTADSFSLTSIQQTLKKRHYQVLASTPSISVFRSKQARLTWHSQGLIQIDLYDTSIQNTQDIKHLIKDILISSNVGEFHG